MKRSFWDFFSREYEVRLSVSPRDTISARSEQRSGISLLAPDETETFPVRDEAGIETTLDMLRKLRPQILRFSAGDPDPERWLEFCRREEIHPHICFRPDDEPEKVRTIVNRCISDFAGNDLWRPVRFYEVLCDPNAVSFENDNSVEERIGLVRDLGKMLRLTDPEAKIILGGIAPLGENRAKAEIWNCGILRNCAEYMDLIGGFFRPSVLSGRIWDEDIEAIEAEHALAEQVCMGLQRLDRQIRETAPESGIRIAVTGWNFLPDIVPQKRQDSIYYSSAYRSIRRACGTAALFEAGPLFGSGGMLRYEDGSVFGDVFHHHQMLVSSDLPVCLDTKEPDFEKPVPVYRWENITGIGGGEMKVAEVHASRSEDGKRLFLLMTNRSPFKRCVLRVRFYDIPDLRPIAAYILKSDNRQDTVTAQEPEKVFCKEVRLGNCRRMNHVTVEIPECSSVSMLLE